MTDPDARSEHTLADRSERFSEERRSATMTYAKPEVKVLGSASNLIERVPKKSTQFGDDGMDAPAYDLDD
jgi:hypothetical protein